MKTFSEFLVEEYGCDLSDLESTFETLEWKGKTVCEDDYDEHRWYTNYRVVKKFVIDGVDRFFEYFDCSPIGEEADREDCGWEYPDLDDLREVFPKEVLRIEYV